MKRSFAKGLTLSASLLTGTAFAVPPGTPPGLDELPPGRIKEKIQSLPAAAQEQAIEWLKRFNIPAEDYPSLDIDPEGGVFYVEAAIEETDQAEPTTAESGTPQEVTEADAFSLHSNPGATRIIYLDFDGHLIEGTAWNSTESSYQATAFDRDGNNTSFSQSELNDIASIWHRTAEDFAAFDVDVTTELPAEFGPNVSRILITRSTDASGKAMPFSSAGGVAYVGVWGLSNYTYYQPALVYYNNLGGGAPRYVSEAASHEMGHNLGLSHDGTSSGTTYYSGHGSGYTKWAPIMGLGYNAHVTQWSKGDYNDANNTQDDIAIIHNHLHTRPDDHGDDSTTATLLVADDSGNVSATNPQTDLYNYYTENKGIINTQSDTDVFLINAGTGSVDLTIIPSWVAFLDSNARGANLDIQATLTDASGNIVATSNPLDDTYAQVQATINSGVYYLSLTGVGKGDTITSYDDYGSQGMYFIEGTIPPAESVNQPPIVQNDSAQTEENTPVTLYPLTNDSDIDGDTLTVASVSDGVFGTATTDGNAVTYTPNSNQSGTDSIIYTVSDGQGGFTEGSISIEVTPAYDEPEIPQGLEAIDGANGTVSLLWLDTTNETLYEIQRESLHKKRNAWNGTTLVATLAANQTQYTDASGTGTYRYRVRSQNQSGTSTWSQWVEVTVTDSSSEGGKGGKGGGKGNR